MQTDPHRDCFLVERHTPSSLGHTRLEACVRFSYLAAIELRNLMHREHPGHPVTITETTYGVAATRER